MQGKRDESTEGKRINYSQPMFSQALAREKPLSSALLPIGLCTIAAGQMPWEKSGA
jgi:hypothetical protein